MRFRARALERHGVDLVPDLENSRPLFDLSGLTSVVIWCD